ncbi:MAG: uracil phosphoribosyltransferase [Actinomycetes bacterium]|jgi:uracil phosphoribosyltransferase|nr:uracil phosphoribosyltransferase [Actinomycetes bacterium]
MAYGFDNLMVLDHPLVQHKMSILRSTDTGKKKFTELVDEITSLVTYEATRELPLEPVQVTTPLTNATFARMAGDQPVIVPILRAGLGMLDGISRLIPNARVGFLGMFRDEETFEPQPYYEKFPKGLDTAPIFVVDPMLATGGSATAGISFIKRQGGRDIKVMCIVAARRGVQTVLDAHPDVKIYAAAFDRDLTPNAYITPGLGDAGDRLFGTL